MNQTNLPLDDKPSTESSIGMTMGPGYDIFKSGQIDPPQLPGILGQLGQYRLIRVIGEGAAAVVFHAQSSENPSEPLAIKILRPELADRASVRARFVAEARHLQKLKHPHIIEVSDLQTHDKLPFYVMPLMTGGNLAKFIQTEPSTAANAIIQIAIQLASALQYIHTRGLTHRDVKPTNVLLDEHGNAYLADLGLCRDFFSPSDLDGPSEHHLAGTAPYMSPAVIAGQAEDTRCDIYAFGATLYELITGKPPYAADSFAQIKDQIKQGPPSSIQSLVPNLPSDLIRLVKDCMAHDLRNRYASMTNVLDDLKRIQNKQRTSGVGANRSPNLWFRFTGLGLIVILLLLVTYIAWLNTPITSAIPSSVPAQANNAPLQVRADITIPGVPSWNGARLGDWDADGNLDLYLQQDQLISAYTLNGELLAQHNFAMPNRQQFHLYGLYDQDIDHRDEMWVSWSDGSNAQLTLLNQSFFPVKMLKTQGTVFRYPSGGTDVSRLEFAQVIDLDADGHNEILTHVRSGYQLQPRGIICFDEHTGKQKWSYPTAPAPSAQATDLDGDSRMEVIVTSGAPSNGLKLPNGTDDSHAYVFCLDHQGNELWRYMTGDDYSGNVAHIADFDQDGIPEVLVVAAALGENRVGLPEPEFGRIIVLSNKGQELMRYDAGVQIRQHLLFRKTPTSPPQIFFLTHTGILTILDHHLKPIISRQLPCRPGNDFLTHFLLSSDLNNDGSPELIFPLQEQSIRGPINGGPKDQPPDVRWLYNNQILILNTQLQTLAQFTLTDIWKRMQGLSVYLVDIDRDGKQELLCLSDRITLLNIHPEYFEKPQPSPLASSFNIAIEPSNGK